MWWFKRSSPTVQYLHFRELHIEERIEAAYEKFLSAKDDAELKLATNKVSYKKFNALIIAAQKIYDDEVARINPY